MAWNTQLGTSPSDEFAISMSYSMLLTYTYGRSDAHWVYTMGAQSEGGEEQGTTFLFLFLFLFWCSGENT